MKSGAQIAAWLIAGAILRFVLSATSHGTNDIDAWLTYGQTINADGLAQAYRILPRLNHPPIAAGWAALAVRLAVALDLRFEVVFRVPAILADIASAWLVAKIWWPNGLRRAAWAAAAMALNLDALLVSSYHGNTDNVMAYFILLAFYLMDRGGERGILLSATALGLAINVKLLALLFIPPLCARCPPRQLWRCGLGLAFTLVPFIAVALAVGPLFLTRTFGYGSEVNHWGFMYLFTLTGADRLLEIYRHLGRFIVLGASVVIALRLRRIAEPSPFRAAAAVAAATLVLAPGFGVQYTIVAAPLLLAVNLRRGTIYGAIAGLFLLLAYIGHAAGPMRSVFIGSYALPASFCGLAVWIYLIDCLVALV